MNQLCFNLLLNRRRRWASARGVSDVLLRLSRKIRLILEFLQNLLLDFMPFSFFKFAIHQVIVQTSRLVNGSESWRRQVKLYHVIQGFRIDLLDKNVGFEGSFGMSHGKWNVVSRPYIFTVVEAPSRPVAAVTNLLIGCKRCCHHSVIWYNLNCSDRGSRWHAQLCCHKRGLVYHGRKHDEAITTEGAAATDL